MTKTKQKVNTTLNIKIIILGNNLFVLFFNLPSKKRFLLLLGKLCLSIYFGLWAVGISIGVSLGLNCFFLIFFLNLM